MAAIDHAELLRLVRYDPLTGEFWSRVRRQGVSMSRPLGSVAKDDGYRRIKIVGFTAYAHRLAWFYMTGEWPEIDIDHRDLDRDNNAWLNLRLATDTQNHANTGPRKSVSGLKGAHWNRHHGTWQSHIVVQGVNHNLGRFPTAEAAHAAYAEAAIRLHGEFARAA